MAEVPFVEQILVYRSANQNCVFNNNVEHEENLESSRDSEFNLIEPWYMRTTIYWLASIILLSWPLRIFTECRIAHLPYQITKLFGTNYLRFLSIIYFSVLHFYVFNIHYHY